MLTFINNGKAIMVEHDDGQFEIIGEEQKEAFTKAKKELEERTENKED